ncbi:cupin-like domain-containing protein [Allopontixanthobacter sp.]|uniref:cupin-like domain-containing protein n=1 Tax=Allopontixanthobacter sp. TaxID=2906452 RepID=UPI002ABB8FC7|nr:cupin-like domain-containing protein [Allopontixanthobacter sp.]MDZ4307832.1 cupin-like domain-containing protein [Allopontixanthobacter sp.]
MPKKIKISIDATSLYIRQIRSAPRGSASNFRLEVQFCCLVKRGAMKQVKTLSATDASLAAFRAVGEPVLVRGLVADWPIVAAALGGSEKLAARLSANASDAQLSYASGDPEFLGRFHYTADGRQLNFTRHQASLGQFLQILLDEMKGDLPRSLAAQAMPVHLCIPGFAHVHTMPLISPLVMPRMWICNRTEVAAHNDELENLACVVAGRRRFTLFPPEAIGDLYLGPYELTPGGTPISMVHVSAPDLIRYPRYAKAAKVALVTEMEPGDVLYIPYHWYHHVGALDPINILVNYWWDPARQDLGSPWDALLHGIIALRELPPDQRRAWKAVFDHYVFLTNGDPGEHLAPEMRGVLAQSDPAATARLKRDLINNLSEDGQKSGPFA